MTAQPPTTDQPADVVHNVLYRIGYRMGLADPSEVQAEAERGFTALAALRARAAAADNLRADDYRYWNERVRTCEHHTQDVAAPVGDCLICNLDAAVARADKLTQTIEQREIGLREQTDRADELSRRIDYALSCISIMDSSHGDAMGVSAEETLSSVRAALAAATPVGDGETDYSSDRARR